MALARPPAHPGLVEDALLPGFDQLQQVQVRLGEPRGLGKDGAAETEHILKNVAL